MAALNDDLHADVSRRAVDTFFTTIIEHLENGGTVHIRGFGRLTSTVKEDVQRRNPRTGEAVTVARALRVRFRPGKAIKQTLNPDH